MKVIATPIVTATTMVGMLLAVPSAAAQMTSTAPGNFYIGGGAGVADFEDRVEAEDLGDIDLDDDSTAYKFFGGWRATENLGIEGGYRSFGEADAGPLSVETNGLDVNGIGFLPIGPVDLFAKGGVIFWDTDGEGPIPDADGEDLMYGVGGQLNVGRLFFRLESEWFDIDFPDDTQMFSGSVGWTF